MSLPSNKPAPDEVAGGYARLPVRAWRDGRLRAVEDCVAEEAPVALVYNGEPHVVMMATPLDLEDFALGFSFSEGVIEDAGELESLELFHHEGGRSHEIRLHIPAHRHDALLQRRRNLHGRTGCGLCGAETIADAIRSPRRVGAGVAIAAAALRRAQDELRRRQALNRLTGATHAAAWCAPDGAVQLVREDVGRHNALDKLIGAMLRGGRDAARGFVLVTSRASYEMALKAAMAGIPLLAAISAPTDYAIRVAEEAGLSLIGFTRGDSFVIYACPARVQDALLRGAAEGAHHE
ncbi:MAG TPA: formate dehydrogenase accessory sulfurtransferase FdhD [Nevskia sp.]|nr:formate dehydrogenase accessory sulfurtransferase FdhD [Nevskia sp.]